MSQAQAFQMLDFFKTLKNKDVQLMIGTMTSFKVLNQQPTKWATIFPSVEALKYIFSSANPQAINCIHYADYDNNPGLFNTLENVVEYCGGGLHAVQLDMVWPDPHELRRFVKEYNLPIVLQISKRSMAECGDNPAVVAEKVSNEYGDIISHVLLDCSMGKGVPIDISVIHPYIEAIKSYTADVQIAVAGGLGPGTISEVKSLIEQYRVSIDAQSKLRLSGKAEDPIDWDLAEKYVEEAISYY